MLLASEYLSGYEIVYSKVDYISLSAKPLGMLQGEYWQNLQDRHFPSFVHQLRF
jgi:hypothetical protein